jgi:hypothetical protein
MGLFDLPAPLFAAIDGVLATVLPAVVRLAIWGVVAGLITMLLYRRLSNQDRIAELKAQQKAQQKAMTDFEGEFDELMPLIGSTLKLGLKQLSLALGPAVLASVPILFLVIWVAGEFANEAPEAGSVIELTPRPATFEGYRWSQPSSVTTEAGVWRLTWPDESGRVSLEGPAGPVLTFPLEERIAVIHKRQWWNVLMANPLGYLPDESKIEHIDIALPELSVLPFGPGWIRGWMFTFFLVFLASSIAFKFILRID